MYFVRITYLVYWDSVSNVIILRSNNKISTKITAFHAIGWYGLNHGNMLHGCLSC